MNPLSGNGSGRNHGMWRIRHYDSGDRTALEKLLRRQRLDPNFEEPTEELRKLFLVLENSQAKIEMVVLGRIMAIGMLLLEPEVPMSQEREEALKALEETAEQEASNLGLSRFLFLAPKLDLECLGLMDFGEVGWTTYGKILVPQSMAQKEN